MNSCRVGIGKHERPVIGNRNLGMLCLPRLRLADLFRRKVPSNKNALGLDYGFSESRTPEWFVLVKCFEPLTSSIQEIGKEERSRRRGSWAERREGDLKTARSQALQRGT